MKILDGAQMRALDARAIAAGTPGIVLMENAGCRVVERLERDYAPLAAQRVLIVCGKGNNGGDGLVVARQLAMRFHCAALHVMLTCDPAQLRGDAAVNYTMLNALGVTVWRELTPEMHAATLIVDALLGTGLSGPARGEALAWIRRINTAFPAARVVSVDVPSGLHVEGESVRAERTFTFAAPKCELVLPPLCERAGQVEVVPIGIPPAWFESEEYWLNLTTPGVLAPLFAPRARGSHKGAYGHVLVVGGGVGKGGAAAMSGAAALRAGAGLVTVATAPGERAAVTMLMPELMTCAWSDGLGSRTVLALGPGLGLAEEVVALARDYYATAPLPAVIDADALNAIAGAALDASGRVRVLTPHPGEMSRLTGLSVDEIQADRVAVARRFALAHACTLVLKGQRTVIAFPDGVVYVNPSGTPAMATAGSGDILTGLIAGLIAQHKDAWRLAVLAAVWLHGRAGELGAAQLGEASLTATDLLQYLPHAIRELQV